VNSNRLTSVSGRSMEPAAARGGLDLRHALMDREAARGPEGRDAFSNH